LEEIKNMRTASSLQDKYKQNLKQFEALSKHGLVEVADNISMSLGVKGTCIRPLCDYNTNIQPIAGTNNVKAPQAAFKVEVKKRKASEAKQELNLGGDFKKLCQREAELVELRIQREKQQAENVTPEKEKEVNREIKKAKRIRSLIGQLSDGPQKEILLARHDKIIIGLLQRGGFTVEEGK
jgi:hypothetical protein